MFGYPRNGGHLSVMFQSCVEEIGVLTDAPLAAAFCGAGYGPLIDKLVDESWKAAQSVSSMDDVCSEIEGTIKRLYKEYGEIYQAGECPTAELIYGVKTNEDYKLFAADGPIVNEKPIYHSSGAGYYLANFLASRMRPHELNLYQCVILAAYILFQTKKHVEGCGGESHIAVLRDEGANGIVDTSRVEAITNLLEVSDPEVGRLLLSIANLELAEERLKHDFKFLVDGLQTLREGAKEKMKEEDERKHQWNQIWGIKRGPVDFLGLPLSPTKEEPEDETPC